MKRKVFSGIVLLMAAALLTYAKLPGLLKPVQKMPAVPPVQQPAQDNTVVKVALLLDTSNSMDGLIEQAKSRLWNIVNTLSTLKFRNKEVRLEIALYEYGNDGLSVKDNYIRQVAPLTSDLDLISEKLFSLRTNGGNEYCGAVIEESVKQLSWGGNEADMKLIYIAGNEPFNQGNINYKESISGALHKGIFVNTIFCGERTEGVQTFWKDGADKGGGKYFNIDSDRRVRFIETPYDTRIEACDKLLNDTYIPYGSMGVTKKGNQVAQDQNALSISKANQMERAVSKSKVAYKNESWDLVDLAKQDTTALGKIKPEELPAELKGKSKAEIKAIVLQKTRQREDIHNEMATLSKKRQLYIDTENKKHNNQDDLGNAIHTSIIELAKKKGYTVQH